MIRREASVSNRVMFPGKKEGWAEANYIPALGMLKKPRLEFKGVMVMDLNKWWLPGSW